jgi:cell division protein FtsZ
MLEGSDMVFITAGMGGGTGTGAAPVIAEISKKLGALTVGVVTKPFRFEGKRRSSQALQGIEQLKQVVDTIITIPNDRLGATARPGTPIIDIYKKADEVLYYAVRGISDLIIVQGYINVDFADVKTVMSEMGLALMGTAVATGKRRAVEAVQMAIANPLLEDISISGAKGVLMNITGHPENLTFEEFEQASSLIHAETHEDANIIIGQVFDETLGDEIRVTVIATGISESMPVVHDISEEIIVEEDAAQHELEGAGTAVEETQGQKVALNSSGSSLGFDQLDYDELDKPVSLRRFLIRKRRV